MAHQHIEKVKKCMLDMRKDLRDNHHIAATVVLFGRLNGDASLPAISEMVPIASEIQILLEKLIKLSYDAVQQAEQQNADPPAKSDGGDGMSQKDAMLYQQAMDAVDSLAASVGMSTDDDAKRREAVERFRKKSEEGLSTILSDLRKAKTAVGFVKTFAAVLRQEAKPHIESLHADAVQADEAVMRLGITLINAITEEGVYHKTVGTEKIQDPLQKFMDALSSLKKAASDT